MVTMQTEATTSGVTLFPAVANVTLLDKNRTENCTENNCHDPPLLISMVTAVVVASIMLMAVVGNILVIISVLRFERLRIIANSFICSLAFADLFVALTVMTFNASQEIMNRWVFGRVLCNFFNGNDVMFCTASLTHLCCISMDRYIAIMDPFHYDSKMTRLRAAIMLTVAWGASALISHIPIHLGWYTTAEAMEKQLQNPHTCMFVPNKVYAIISSSISFWIPTTIMVFVYVKIYREARRQERRINQLTVNMGSMEKLNNQNGGSPSNGNPPRPMQDRKKMKREHKAAKTLGIIMGAYLICWLPFFVWYVIENLCDTCQAPALLVSILFWVGYMNSAINPVIYAFFNRDFRNAFRKLLGLEHAKLACYCSLCPAKRSQQYGGDGGRELRDDSRHSRSSNSTPVTLRTARHSYSVVVTET